MGGGQELGGHKVKFLKWSQTLEVLNFKGLGFRCCFILEIAAGDGQDVDLKSLRLLNFGVRARI